MTAPTLVPIPAPRPRESAWLWLYKIVAGLLIVVLLAVHFIVNHAVAPGGLLTYADVIRYYKNPLIPIMEIALLVFVTTHGLVGLRGILLDLNPSPKALKAIDFALSALGIIALVYGVWLVIAISRA